jgi:hypothetical protein
MGGVRDVFLATPPQRAGTYAAIECARPVECAEGARRIWLVTEATAADPLDGIGGDKESLLRQSFTVSGVQAFNRVRLVRLDRLDRG